MRQHVEIAANLLPGWAASKIKYQTSGGRKGGRGRRNKSQSITLHIIPTCIEKDRIATQTGGNSLLSSFSMPKGVFSDLKFAGFAITGSYDPSTLLVCIIFF